jgi:PilZ domain
VKGGFGPRGLERRRSVRVRVAELEGAVELVGAAVVTVSPHGMRIASPVPLETEAILSLRLSVLGHKSDVEARVVACRLVPSGGRRRYEIGLEFVHVPPRTRELLTEVLSRPRTHARTA